MLDDLARSARWHGQADADITAIGADDRAVHADRFATHVDQGAARVPRVDRRIGLDVASAAVGRAAQPAADSRRDDLRSEERRVGQECVSTCSSRWSPYHSKKNNQTQMLIP